MQVEFVEESRCADVVDMFVMCAAKWETTPTNMVNLCPVVTHADSVNVMQIRFLTAYSAFFAKKAAIHVSVNIVRKFSKRSVRRDIVAKNEVDQIVDELPRRCHVAIRKTEKIAVKAFDDLLAKFVFHRFLDLVRFVSSPFCDLTHKCISFPALFRGDLAPVFKADNNFPILTADKPFCVVIRGADGQETPIRINNLAPDDFHVITRSFACFRNLRTSVFRMFQDFCLPTNQQKFFCQLLKQSP